MQESLERDEKMKALEYESSKLSFSRYQKAAESFAREVELMVSSNNSLIHGTRPNISRTMDLDIQSVMGFRRIIPRQSKINEFFTTSD